MINNGGTLVGRFYVPIFAEAGSTVSSAGGVSLGAGALGAIGRTETLRAAGSAVAEVMSSFAIRDLAGTSDQTAELLIGARVGYARSEKSLLQAGGNRGTGFGQLAIGLRRNGQLSLSALVTRTQDEFSSVVPKLQVNFSAVR